MKQKLIKLVKQKTKINRDIGKLYYNIEMNHGETNKIIERIEIIKRTIRNRKNKNKIYDDLSLRITELRKAIIH